MTDDGSSRFGAGSAAGLGVAVLCWPEPAALDQDRYGETASQVRARLDAHTQPSEGALSLRQRPRDSAAVTALPCGSVATTGARGLGAERPLRAEPGSLTRSAHVTRTVPRTAVIAVPSPCEATRTPRVRSTISRRASQPVP